jgi:hypothetical protein
LRERGVGVIAKGSDIADILYHVLFGNGSIPFLSEANKETT